MASRLEEDGDVGHVTSRAVVRSRAGSKTLEVLKKGVFSSTQKYQII